ncbi:hypothetical protein VNI00_012799 [Paramarasmius palmivorus]|uniref:F-box domain-containing protein n=1 Tax=Paramarasmius palmivorus TaxID=297713 RepID=A0AAW0C4W6_9AGAR
MLCDKCNTSIRHIPRPLSPYITQSDYVPSATEAAALFREIEEEEEVLGRYLGEIHRLQRALNELEAERAAIEEGIRKRRSTVSALRKLPLEILEKIFNLVCFERVGNKGSYSLLIRSTSIHALTYNLSHTSSHWRKVVQNLPGLWSSIHVEICGLKRDVRPLLRDFAMKSSGNRLKISIAEPDKDDHAEEFDGPDHISYTEQFIGEDGMEAFWFLASQMQHCNTLHLDVNWEVLEAQRTNVSVSFTDLIVFAADVNMDTRWAAGGNQPLRPKGAWFWDAFQGALQTKELALSGTLAPRIHFTLYKHLSHLDIWHYNVEGLPRILGQTPGLISLRLGEIWSTPGPSISNQVVLPMLQSFQLEVAVDHWQWELFELSALFQILVMPRLVSLNMQSSVDTNPMEEHCPDSLMAMFQHFSSSLRTLTFNFPCSVFPGRDSLSRLLQPFPFLTTLRIAVCEDTKGSQTLTHLLSRLTVSATGVSEALLPKLETFSYHGYRSCINDTLVKDFLDMVESRTASASNETVVPLCQVELKCHGGRFGRSGTEQSEILLSNPLIVSRIERLTKQGIVCTVQLIDSLYLNG